MNVFGTPVGDPPGRSGPIAWAGILAACLTALLIGPPLAQAKPESSVIAPLAVRSLLLDGARFGKRCIAVGERGDVLLSDDGGSTWRQVIVPTRSTLTGVFFHDARLGWIVGHDAVILRTEDGGETWKLVHFAPQEERPLFDVWFRDARHGLAIGAYGLVLASDDGGVTWEERRVEKDDWHLNAIAASEGGRLYIAGEAGHLYRSEDDGKTWEPLTSPYKGSFFGVMALGEDTVLAFGLRGHLFRSEDGGESWQTVPTGTTALLTDGVRLHDGRVVIVGLDGVVLESGDGARHFSLQRQPDRRAITAVFGGGNGGLILLSEEGVIRLPLAKMQSTQIAKQSAHAEKVSK